MYTIHNTLKIVPGILCPNLEYLILYLDKAGTPDTALGIMYTALAILYSVPGLLYTVPGVLYTLLGILYTVPGILYTVLVHCALC